MGRYEDLLRLVPRGSAYSNSGYVLPYRDDAQEFLFEDASAPNEVYGVFVDSIFQGTVEADIDGVVIVSVNLDPGPHEIVVENDTTARRFRAYVTVRDYAVWYASYAESLEGSSTFFGIDPAISSVEAAPPLSTADSIHIENVHGRVLRQPNEFEYITDSYRTVLQGLRQAFRLYTGKPAGVVQAVASFTNSLPFLVPQAWRPRWWLGGQFAPNPDLDQRTHVVQSALPNLNEVSLSAVGSILATSASATPTNPPTAQRLVVVFPVAWDGGNITLTGLNPSGDPVSEVFTPIGTPLAGFITKNGAETFSTVTAISNSVIGTTGTARIGLTENAFVDVVRVDGTPIREGEVTVATTYLTLNNEIGEGLSLSFGPDAAGVADNRVLIPGSGRYEVPYKAQGDKLFGVAEPLAGWNFGSAGQRTRDRLTINIGDRGPTTVLLGVIGGLIGNDVADVVTDINNALTTDIRYGSGAAGAEPSSSNLVGDTFRIDSSLLPIAGGTTQSSILIEMDCADASREVFGIPRFVGDSPAPATTSATTLKYGPGNRIGTIEAPYTARVGRGFFASGTGTISNSAGRFCDFGATALDLRVGECIRLNTTTTSPGLHRIVQVLSASSWRLKHESPTGTFTNGGGQAYSAWIMGDLVNVTAVNTTLNDLTIEAPGLPRGLPSGYQIELAGEMPYETRPDRSEAPATLVVDVDLDYAPSIGIGGDIEDDLGLVGEIVPDGWLVNSGTSILVKPRGLLTESGVSIERGASDIEFQAEISRVVPTYLGFPIRCQFWVQQHNDATQTFRIDVSWDEVTFDTGNPITVPGSLESDGGNRRSRIDPYNVSRLVTPPFDATTMIVRLVSEGAGAGERVTIEKAVVTPEINTAYWMGKNTIVRSEQSSNFGQLLYIWSPEDLTALENTAIGVDPTATRPSNQDNQIDRIVPAHVTVERWDISEYDGLGNPLNVLGSYDDIGWFVTSLTNMEVVVGVPGRLTYARPTITSAIFNEELSPDAFGVAVTSQPTTHVGPYPQVPNGRFSLFEDGVPVPDTADASAIQPYEFTSIDTVDIDNGVYIPAATYTATYDALVSAETAAINLGAGASNYLWFVDAYIWRAIEQIQGTRERTTALTFFSDLTSTLDIPSDSDQNTATLIADNGASQTIIPDRSWTFVDQNTIRINPGTFDANSLYTLTYTSIFSTFVQQPDIQIQLRSAVSAGGLAAQTYENVSINTIVDNTLQFHQLRILIFGVNDIEDIRVHSLGLRGLHIFGNNANAPGLILP